MRTCERKTNTNKKKNSHLSVADKCETINDKKNY